MFYNYFKTAWRNLWRNKTYSFIAIFGLAIGLSVSILIFWGVNDELTYDNIWPDASDIYRINPQYKNGDNVITLHTATMPLAAAALKEIPAVLDIARYRVADRLVITGNGDHHFIEKKAAYTEPSFFRMFHIHFLNGNARTALDEINNVVLSRNAAIKYFGSVNAAVGNKLLIGEVKPEPYTVSAIMADIPQKSSIQMDMLLSLNQVRKHFGGNGEWKTIDEDWGNNRYESYIRLQPGNDPKEIEKSLVSITMKNNHYMKPGEMKVFLQPLNKLRLYSPDMHPFGMKIVRIFFLTGILILLIAIINYVNLSTASATKRASEIGLRRVVGAQRKQLIWQFIIEFILIFIIALCIALFLLLPALTPLYKSISGKDYTIDYWNFSTFKIILAVAISTILLGSLYPAWTISAFNPVQVLKSNFVGNAKGNLLRKMLVVLQFSFSVLLIICTIVIAGQLHYIQTVNLGFKRDNVLVTRISGKNANSSEYILQRLKADPNILDACYAQENILDMETRTDNITWPGKDPDDYSTTIYPMGVSPNFASLMKMEFANGSNFTNTVADSGYYLINEAAAKEMHLKNPVGTVIKLWGYPAMIKGVIKDFHNASFKSAINPTLFYMYKYPGSGFFLYVKVSGKNIPHSVDVVKKVLQSTDAANPFEYTFLDDDFDKMYRREMQTAALFKFFAAITILLSCMGLFGLAVFIAERKVKEIGIRKVLGASVADVTTLLSADFLKLVLVSIIIATPVAWWVMNNWLQDYAYRITMRWWIFLIAGVLAIFIALITISFQAVKAALANPVEALRTE